MGTSPINSIQPRPSVLHEIRQNAKKQEIVPLRTEEIHVVPSQTPLYLCFSSGLSGISSERLYQVSHRFSRFLWQRGDLDETAHEADANSVPCFSGTGRPKFRCYLQWVNQAVQNSSFASGNELPHLCVRGYHFFETNFTHFSACALQSFDLRQGQANIASLSVSLSPVPPVL